MENAALPLEKELEPIFTEKLPAFPENIKDILVQLAPWLALIGAIMGLLAFVSLIGLGSFVSAVSIGVGAYGSTWQMWVSILALGATAVLCALAFKPLQNKERKGWNYMYYSSLISVASSVLSFNIIGAILSFVIGFWILFQVRSRYTN
jgi:hypothetical protein